MKKYTFEGNGLGINWYKCKNKKFQKLNEFESI
jgi:hypothetical protein